MILGSQRKKVVGERLVGLSDSDGVDHPDQPYVILREATLAEYLAESPHALGIVPRAVLESAFYYEVSLD